MSTDLNDGFGSALTTEERIIANERLLKLKAAERIREPEFWDDILQEGRIVQWQVLEKRPDSAPSYVGAAMTNRMNEVITRRAWFGSEAKRGHPVDPIRRSDRDSFDDPDFHDVATASDALDKVIFAYHHGEILQALCALTKRQRLYVHMRFWEGLTVPEIAAKLDSSKATLEREWRTQTRPTLMRELSHLQELLS